jgi:prevent-host-death family protein
MREIQLHDAEATLADVVDSARNGEPSVITRHGRPEAVVLGFDDWERLSRVPSFARLLMADAMDEDESSEHDGPD